MDMVNAIPRVGGILALFLKRKFGNGEVYASIAAASWAVFSRRNARIAGGRIEELPAYMSRMITDIKVVYKI